MADKILAIRKWEWFGRDPVWLVPLWIVRSIQAGGLGRTNVLLRTIRRLAGNGGYVMGTTGNC